MQKPVQPNGFSYVLGYHKLVKAAELLCKSSDDRYGSSLSAPTLSSRWQGFKQRFARSPLGLAPAGVASGVTDAAGDVTGYIGRATSPIVGFVGGERGRAAYENAMTNASSAMHGAAGYIRAANDFDDATVPGKPDTYGSATSPESQGLGAMSTGFRAGGDALAAYAAYTAGPISNVASRGGQVSSLSDAAQKGMKGDWAGAAVSGIPTLMGFSNNGVMNGVSNVAGYVGSAQNAMQGLAKSSQAAPVYTVQRGDALERIARRHGTTAREIAALNGIKDPSRILIGQKLRLPVVAPKPAASARPVTPAPRLMPAPRPVPAAPATPTPAPATPAATNAPAWTPPPKPAGTPPLGYTNNNPGNIRDFGIKWEGLVPGTRKGEFAKFQDMGKGFRALARNVISWKTKHNFSTVEQGVGRHAPPSENNTGKYIQAIADRLGVKPGQAVDFADKSTVHKIVPAIAEQEIGPWYRQVDPAVISNAVESAFAGLNLKKKAP